MRTCSRIRRCGCQRESLSQPSAAPTGLVFFQAQPGPVGADRGYEGCDGGVSGTSRHRSSSECGPDQARSHRKSAIPWERACSRRQRCRLKIQRGKFTQQAGCQAASRAFDLAFDFGRPVKPRWPNVGLEPWATRQDAGLAALGQGWPFAAAHGSRSAGGYTEPKRGAEWWGTDLLVTFGAFAKSDPP